MKKLVLVFILCLSIFEVFAQNNSTLWFRTTEFAWKYKESGVWSEWSDWIESNMKVKFDLNKDQIIIYSPSTQVYTVLGVEEPPYDPNGQQVKYRIIDQEEDFGYLRLRIEKNGNSQIYIDFADLRWVYNVIRIQ